MVSVFTKAFALSVVVFAAGILVGVWFDSSRVEELRETLTKQDISFNDARLQNLYYQIFSNETEFCESALKSNTDFSLKIYEEGKELERFEAVNRFALQIVDQKRRYALLQLQFWLNSVYLKEKCGKSYATLLYFYSHYNQEAANDQNVQSRVVLDLIEKCGPEKLLSAPIPIDLNISMVDLLREKHSIAKTPSILINEKTLLEGLQSKDELEKHIEC